VDEFTREVPHLEAAAVAPTATLAAVPPIPSPEPPRVTVSGGLEWRFGQSVSQVQKCSLVAEGENLAEAMQELQRHLPLGMMIIEQDMISDGSYQVVAGTGATVDEALAEARAKLPPDAVEPSEKVVWKPLRGTLRIEAATAEDARSLAMRCPAETSSEVIHSEPSVVRKIVPPPERTVDVFLERKSRNGIGRFFRHPARFLAVVTEPMRVKSNSALRSA
jgi:hypothetical protein